MDLQKHAKPLNCFDVVHLHFYHMKMLTQTHLEVERHGIVRLHRKSIERKKKNVKKRLLTNGTLLDVIFIFIFVAIVRVKCGVQIQGWDSRS